MQPIKILVTFVNKYEMKDEQGRDRRGVSVQYMFFGENGEQLQAREVDFEKANGWRTAKGSLPIELLGKFKAVPGIYDGNFEMNVGSDGKPTNKLIDVDFLGVPQIKMQAVAK